MSYILFRQECEDCDSEWNAAFSFVGTTQIMAPPEKCPSCSSKNIRKASDGWRPLDGEIISSSPGWHHVGKSTVLSWLDDQSGQYFNGVPLWWK